MRVSLVLLMCAIGAIASSNPIALLNPYTVLGVQPNESIEGIQKAFRNLALKWHPDRRRSNGRDTFARIKESYDILMDSKMRSNFDRFGVKTDASSYRNVHVPVPFWGYRDPDSSSMSVLLNDDNYASIVTEQVGRFSQIWLIKIYSRDCRNCNRIQQQWETSSKVLFGHAHMGRINADVSSKLLRALGVRTVPSILAVVPDLQSNRPLEVRTQVLRGVQSPTDISVPKLKAFLQSAFPGNIANIRNVKSADQFTRAHSDQLHVIFLSRSSPEPSLALSRFVFQNRFKRNVAFAYAHVQLPWGSSSSVPEHINRLLTRGCNSTSVDMSKLKSLELGGDIWFLPETGLPTISLNDRQSIEDWEALLRINPTELITHIDRNSRMFLPELTSDSYYDECYIPSNRLCIILVDVRHDRARTLIKGLHSEFDLQSSVFSSTSAPIAFGWIDPIKQIKFLEAVGVGSKSQQNNSLQIVAIRPASQMFTVFDGEAFNYHDVYQWIVDVNEKRVTMKNGLKTGGLPFLAKPVPFLSFFSFPLLSFIRSLIFTLYSVFVAPFVSILFYVVILGGALVFLFLAPMVAA